MGERIMVAIATIATAIMLPYMMTMIMNGRYGDSASALSEISTGRDILMQVDGANVLMDVEQYVAGVLPGLVSPNEKDEVIEAQAVAVRTRIYYLMGKNTVIKESDLGFKYFTKQEYIDRFGKLKYKKVKNKYESAVLNTKQQIIE